MKAIYCSALLITLLAAPGYAETSQKFGSGSGGARLFHYRRR